MSSPNSLWDKAVEIRKAAALAADPMLRDELIVLACRFERLALYSDEPPSAAPPPAGGAAAPLPGMAFPANSEL